VPKISFGKARVRDIQMLCVESSVINVEENFDLTVSEVGGNRIVDIVGPSANFHNADYLFREYKVVAELKCLDEDPISTERMRSKASDLYGSLVSQGLAPKLKDGVNRINCEGLPESFKEEIVELYRKTIHSIVKKANSQIKQTKANLGLEDHHGLLIIANNNNSALDPAVAMYILSRTFERYSFGSIDSVLYFTVNLKAYHHKVPQDVLVWIPSHRSPDKKCPEELHKRLKNSWFNRVADLTGETVTTYQARGRNVINEITNIDKNT
jgi:hypothetical protein